MTNGFNPLLAIPSVIVTTSILTPVLFLDGARAYVTFLWHNPTLVVVTASAWWIVLYWITRRLASVLLLRSSGAKLRVGNALQS